MMLLQADPTSIDQGMLDKIIGPMGGFCLSLLILGLLARHHLSALAAHQARVDELQEEIKRLSEARIDAAQGEARDLIQRFHDMDAGEARRWGKLSRILGLSQPLGISLSRIEMMLRAIAKKMGAATPPPETPAAPSPLDDEADGKSMF